jgi:hypothetical protein
MSALAFGEPMGYTKGESNDTAKSVLDNIQRGVDAIGLLLHVPWLMGTLTTFSWAIGPMREWNQYSESLVIKRKSVSILNYQYRYRGPTSIDENPQTRSLQPPARQY